MSKQRFLCSLVGLLACASAFACAGSDGSPGDGSGGLAGASGAATNAGAAGNTSGAGGTAGTVGASGAAGTVDASGAAGTVGAAGSGTAAVIEGRLSAGSGFACGIGSDAGLVCWGGGSSWSAQDARNAGQARVSAAGESWCAVSSVGALWCRGQVQFSTLPSGVFSRVAVSNDNQACALADDHTVKCWGASITQWLVPTSTFKELAAGLGFACGLHDNGSIECWGPAAPSGAPAGSFVKVFASNIEACALRADGTAACWGTGASPSATGTFSQLALGKGTAAAFTCALDFTGRVTCSGKDSNVIGQAPLLPMSAIAAGDGFACGLHLDGTASCWGSLAPSPPAAFKAF